jgi:hypothetical protein
MSKVLCSVATRGRYFTTLPLVLNAIIMQTRVPDKLVIYDDNDEPQDMRKEYLYGYFFQMLEAKGIAWEWLYAERKGQHYIHQRANQKAVREGYEWVWRVDDDAVPEPNVLQELHRWTEMWPELGAVGSHIWTPPNIQTTAGVTGRIDNIDSEPNIQWGKFNVAQEVDHLHCSFLYKAGIADYNTGLSRVAHREETLFTYQMAQKGYSVLVVPNAITWHLRNPEGGIRSENKKQMFDHDEQIFRNILAHRDKTIVVLNCGLGDHLVFSKVLPEIRNPVVFSCYPEVIPGRSIAEAQQLFGSLEPYNIYGKMDLWRWTGSLEDAYRKLYL